MSPGVISFLSSSSSISSVRGCFALFVGVTSYPDFLFKTILAGSPPSFADCFWVVRKRLVIAFLIIPLLNFSSHNTVLFAYLCKAVIDESDSSEDRLHPSFPSVPKHNDEGELHLNQVSNTKYLRLDDLKSAQTVSGGISDIKKCILFHTSARPPL